MLIILTGKTASGKDTVATKLLVRYPSLKKITTTTSRLPRHGEKDGVNHHFLSKGEFEKKITEGSFAEYVQYGGNLYGTQKKDLEQAVKQDTLWRIDPSRAGEARDFISRTFPQNQARKLIDNLIVIYISAPDEVILERLKARWLTDEEIQRRLADDKKIWQQYKDAYDFVVENIPGKLNETISQIVDLIESQR